MSFQVTLYWLWGVLETTLRLGDSLGFTGLRSCFPRSRFSTVQGHRAKSVKTGECAGKPETPHLVQPPGRRSAPQHCHSTCGVGTTREAHWRLSVQGLLGAGHVGTLCLNKPGFQTPRRKADVYHKPHCSSQFRHIPSQVLERWESSPNLSSQIAAKDQGSQQTFPRTVASGLPC